MIFVCLTVASNDLSCFLTWTQYFFLIAFFHRFYRSLAGPNSRRRILEQATYQAIIVSTLSLILFLLIVASSLQCSNYRVLKKPNCATSQSPTAEIGVTSFEFGQELQALAARAFKMASDCSRRLKQVQTVGLRFVHGIPTHKKLFATSPSQFVSAAEFRSIMPIPKVFHLKRDPFFV